MFMHIYTHKHVCILHIHPDTYKEKQEHIV